MATVPQFPTGTMSRASLNTFVTETTTNLTDTNIASGAAIADVKLSIPNRIKQTQRQGGSATDWNTTGTTTQTVTNPVIQAGVGTTGSASFSSPVYYAQVSIVFPTAYTNKPIVAAWLQNVAATAAFGCSVNAVTTTGCDITVNSTTSGYVASSVVGWLAIGT